jgi:excinuclease UvrABC nuclease subunit
MTHQYSLFTLPKPDPEESIQDVIIRGREKSGVYFLWLNEWLVYVGKSLKLNVRISGHMHNPHMVFDCASFVEVLPEELDDFEKFCIKRFDPVYNVTHKEKKR